MRTRFFGNLVALMLSLAVLAGAELVLRATGLPRNGVVFLKRGNEVRLAPGAVARYFAPRSPLVPEARSEAFLYPKPKGLLRIFCLGGSSMAGYPFTYNGTLPTLLADRLSYLFPDTTIEVLNLAVSAIGSYAVLDICRHAIAFDPDVVIVYAGHNEFYGALGAASTMRSVAPRWLTLLHLRLQDSALYRLCWDALGSLRASRQPSVSNATLMARMVGNPCVPCDSPVYRRTVQAFCANLRALCRLCRGRGIPLVVCELVSNLRDQPPFPVCREDTSSSLPEGAWSGPSAYELFERGRAAEREGESALARRLYGDARDADQCRFRAPSEFNDSLRVMAAREGATLVPLESRFFAASPYPAPGYDLFLDHLHPNLDGYLLVAGAISDALRDHHVLVPSSRWPRQRELSTGQYRERALVTQLEYAIAVDKIRRLMGHWPFSPDQPAPVYVFDDSIMALAQRYHDQHLAWSEVHFMAADYLVRHEKYAAALRETQAVLKQAAGFWPAWLKMGDVCLAQHRAQEAVEAYRTASRFSGGSGHCLAKLGSALLASGDAEEAIQVFLAARRPEAGLSSLDRARAGYLLGRAYQRLGRREELERVILELLGEPDGIDLGRRLRQEVTR